MVPGMDHCGIGTDGPGISDTGIDPLTALEQWVEEGKAPDQLIATKTAGPVAKRFGDAPCAPTQRWRGIVAMATVLTRQASPARTRKRYAFYGIPDARCAAPLTRRLHRPHKPGIGSEQIVWRQNAPAAWVSLCSTCCADTCERTMNGLCCRSRWSRHAPSDRTRRSRGGAVAECCHGIEVRLWAWFVRRFPDELFGSNYGADREHGTNPVRRC